MKVLFAILGLIVGLCSCLVTKTPSYIFAICGGVFVISVIIMLIAIANAEEFPHDGRM